MNKNPTFRADLNPVATSKRLQSLATWHHVTTWALASLLPSLNLFLLFLLFLMLGQGRKGKSPSLVGGSQTKRSSLALTLSISRICGRKVCLEILPRSFSQFSPNLRSFADFDLWPRGTAYHMQASNWGWSCAQKKPVKVTRQRFPSGSPSEKTSWIWIVMAPANHQAHFRFCVFVDDWPRTRPARKLDKKEGWMQLVSGCSPAVSLRTRNWAGRGRRK